MKKGFSKYHIIIIRTLPRAALTRTYVSFFNENVYVKGGGQTDRWTNDLYNLKIALAFSTYPLMAKFVQYCIKAYDRAC